MSVSEIKTSNNSWLPKEIPTAAVGATTAATAGVAIQYLITVSTKQLPKLARNFIGYSCGAAAIAGTVITLTSVIHLCKKIMDGKTPPKAILVTSLGVFATALAQTIYKHFWTIAPDFGYRGLNSMAYCIATNFGLQLSAIAGIAGVAFIAYAAYRTGEAIYKSSIVQHC